MIRRHITPALVFFILLLVCCLARVLPGLDWRLLLAAASVPGAAGVALLRPPGRGRAAVLVLAACAGLVLGGLSLLRMSDEAQRAFLPAPAAEISGFSGVLREDSVLTQKGTTVLRVALRSAVSARRGLQGEARGSIVVFLPGDYRFAMGEVLSFRAPLAASLRPSAREQLTAGVQRGMIHTEGFAGRAWAVRADVRDWLHRAVARAGYPASALMEALLIGSREDVPAALYDGFRRTGSLHILALSGLH
ncbi:MAG: ComEC/Rec2 family competence protein, partial [Spirochaetia bacterium]